MTKHEKEGQIGEKCCEKCLWGYSSGETKCIKEECACHTLNFPRREEHCHLCQPSEEKEERNNFGNCIYCGLKKCSHQPSEENWEIDFRKEFKGSAHHKTLLGIEDFISKAIASAVEARERDILKEAKNRINSAGGIGGWKHLEDILEDIINPSKE